MAEIILLFRAECNNFNNKWLSHVTKSQVERLELLADKQYVSCQYKNATTQCLNKWLWYDYVWCCHELATLCSNDAKSCYDKIVFACASFVSMSIGCFHTIGFWYDQYHPWYEPPHSNSLQRFSIKWEVHNVGSSSNGHWPRGWSWSSNLGNGQLTLIWNYATRQFLATLQCAMLLYSKILLDFLCWQYQSVHPEGTVGSSQHCHPDATIGWVIGTLVPDKCFWYLIDQQWSQGQLHDKTAQQNPTDLVVADSTGRKCASHIALEPLEAWHTLGVWLAPDGNSTAEYHYLKSVVREW